MFNFVNFESQFLPPSYFPWYQGFPPELQELGRLVSQQGFTKGKGSDEGRKRPDDFQNRPGPSKSFESNLPKQSSSGPLNLMAMDLERPMGMVENTSRTAWSQR